MSTLLRAGAALLLVGAILSFLAVPMVALAGVATGFPPLVLGGAALLFLVGGVLGVMAYAKAQKGDLANAFLLGLMASLAPPVQPLLLVGAILCKAAPAEPVKPQRDVVA